MVYTLLYKIVFNFVSFGVLFTINLAHSAIETYSIIALENVQFTAHSPPATKPHHGVIR